MKTIRILVLALSFIFVHALASQAQFAFGIGPFCASDKDYPKITVPAATWLELAKTSKEGVPPADACLNMPAGDALAGYQADYDGDGAEEMWLLYHAGPADAGCNVIVMLTKDGGGYKLEDMLAIPGGKAMIRPIQTLKTGVQMYVQNTYTLPDGNKETKGMLLGYQQHAVVILISWAENGFVKDGKKFTQKVDAAFSDVNFDNQKELFLRYSVYETAGKITEKNLVDRSVRTLDFVPNHLRYVVYDSVGFDKVATAEAKAKAGLRAINRESTRDDGILKIQDALRADPFDAKTRTKLGQFFLMNGKYGDAERTLLLATEFDPMSAKAFKLLGDTYLRLNDLQKVLTAYTRYLELTPKDNGSLDYRQVKHNIKQITIPKARVR
jgi:hypothetical protein